jgi:DNA polymerase I
MVVEISQEEYDRFTDLEPRVCTLDIEVDDRGDGFPELGDERILSIVAHDSIEDEFVGFIDLNGRAIEDAFPNGAPDNIDEVHVQDSERKMLTDFRSWFTRTDPDLITGWNADGFDIPFILKRFRNIDGLNANALSRLGWAGVTSRGEPRIKGRTVYDLLTVYKKNSFTNLRSYKLDDVAKEEIGAEKIEFEGGYFDLYESDTETFVEYNAHDVRLTVDINDEAGVIDFRDTLRREVGVDFEESYNANDFIEMMCRRRLKERGEVGPTARGYDEIESSDYDGAYVFDAYTGVTQNVVGIDLSSLYPYTMAMLNASPEMQLETDDNGNLTGYDVTGDPVPEEADIAEAANGAYFRLDKDGLFKSLIDDAISLKAEYKEKRDNADTDAEYEKWATKYMSAKTITNSIYGVTGWELFFLYEKDVAAAVTLTGQEVIKGTAGYVENAGHDVIYGDTDSTYIELPQDWSRDECLNEAFRLCEELNEDYYPELAADMGVPPEDNLWNIEVEAYMERFFQAGRKKRYAYLATWKDGREVDDPKPSISGFSSRRSDSSRLTRDTEREVLEEILHGNTESVHDIVFEAAQEIEAVKPEWERIGIPGGMNNKINPARAGQDGYYAFSSKGNYPQDAHPRAVWNANKILDVNIQSGDKPMRVYVEPKVFEEVERQIDVIAFERNTDMAPIEDGVRVDVARMTETLLISPLEEILRAIDIDPHAAVQGQTQQGLGAFE